MKQLWWWIERRKCWKLDLKIGIKEKEKLLEWWTMYNALRAKVSVDPTHPKPSSKGTCAYAFRSLASPNIPFKLTIFFYNQVPTFLCFHTHTLPPNHFTLFFFGTTLDKFFILFIIFQLIGIFNLIIVNKIIVWPNNWYLHPILSLCTLLIKFLTSRAHCLLF